MIVGLTLTIYNAMFSDIIALPPRKISKAALAFCSRINVLSNICSLLQSSLSKLC